MNEGANKGILVCTSQYGKDAYRFCEDKPIELIDGGGLLYLLKSMLGYQHVSTPFLITVPARSNVCRECLKLEIQHKISSRVIQGY